MAKLRTGHETAPPRDADTERLPPKTPPSPVRLLFLELGLIFVGGFVGTLARVLVVRLVGPFDHGFPYDIALVNLTGASAIGIFAGWRDPRRRDHELLWLTGATGFLGAYTTFSSFALGIVTLASNGTTFLSFLYLGGSVALGYLAVEGGFWLGERLRRT